MTGNTMSHSSIYDSDTSMADDFNGPSSSSCWSGLFGGGGGSSMFCGSSTRRSSSALPANGGSVTSVLSVPMEHQQLHFRDKQKWNQQPPTTSSSSSDSIMPQPLQVQSAYHDDTGVDVVAEALSSLSMNDRTKVLDDLHGVVTYNKDIDENPNKVEKCLQELDKEITKLCQADSYDTNTQQTIKKSFGGYEKKPSTEVSTTAYKQAISTSVGDAYVSNPEFKLMFLRCDDWDVSKASKRLVGFMESKLMLFGPDLLTKDITLAELLSTATDKENRANGEATLLETFVSGWHQIVPLKDRSNRHVSIMNPTKLPKNSTAINVCKTAYYNLMTLIHNDPMAQTLGLVEMSYDVSFKELFMSGKPYVADVLNGITKFRETFPAKSAAIHGCTYDPMYTMVLKTMKYVLNPPMLSRFKIHHCAQYMEIQYELLSYGIPIAALPIDFNGQWHTRHHQTWVQCQFDLMQQKKLQIQQEQIFQAFDSIDVTNLIEGDANDVDSLFGCCDGDDDEIIPNSEDIIGDTFAANDDDDLVIATTVTSSIAQSSPPRHLVVHEIEATLTEQPSPQRAIVVPSAPHMSASNLVMNGFDTNDKEVCSKASDAMSDEALTKAAQKATKVSSSSSSTAVVGTASGTRKFKSDPSPNDVLLGKRGKAIWKQQAGNKLYMQLMETYYESYENAPKFRKQEIGDIIISKIYDTGGTFLNYDNTTQSYFELDNEQVLREKVSSLFRNKRRDVNNLRKKKKKGQNNK